MDKKPESHAAAQRLAEKRDRGKRMQAFYERERTKVRATVEENVARRAQEVVDRDGPRTRPVREHLGGPVGKR